MDNPRGYFDYSVSEEAVKSGDFQKLIRKLIDFGYRTIAVNQVIREDEILGRNKKGPGKADKEVIPAPLNLKRFESANLRILNRLTVAFENKNFLPTFLKSPNTLKFDILAVLPQSQNAIQACAETNCDIISFDPENKPNYKLNRKTYNSLLRNGCHFEIFYGAAIKDTTQRKNTIIAAHNYHMVGKSRGIIISSGATNDMTVRSPYDVVNLGFIFGLSESQAKDSVLDCGRKVFLHAVGRRHKRAVMFVETLNPVAEQVKKGKKRKLDTSNGVVQPGEKIVTID